MEINNLPGRVQNNGHKDAHQTRMNSGRTSKKRENIKKN